MPGYFPKEGGWPAIARTTPGLIRGTVYKHLDQYESSMNDAILSQLRTLEFRDGGKSIHLAHIDMTMTSGRMHGQLLRLRILGGCPQWKLRHGWLATLARRGISQGC